MRGETFVSRTGSVALLSGSSGGASLILTPATLGSFLCCCFMVPVFAFGTGSARFYDPIADA